MEFRYYREELAEIPLLSVDGICPTGPNLSHWPGNRTPSPLKHDLSTGILLRFAALPKRERNQFLQGIDLVSNNHFDTDGLLSLYVALQPEKALRYSGKMLAAAEAGDFNLGPTKEAVQFDLLVEAFCDPKLSPIGLELWNLSDSQRQERAYQVLLEMMPRLFDQLDQFKALWAEGFSRFENSHNWLRRSGKIRKYDEIDLAIIETDQILDRRAVQTVAKTDRVLLVQHTPEGNLYHFWYAATSWFDMVSTRKPSRISLDQIAKTMNKECAGIDGSWIGDSLEEPVANLFFGEKGKAKSISGLPGSLLPNPILISKVETIFVQSLQT